MSKPNRLLPITALASFLLVNGLHAHAAQLDLPTFPLYLGQVVDPNVFFEVDDSGSMDWEILTRQHWHFCAYDYNAGGGTSSSDCGWLVDNGLWRTYTSGYRYFYYVFDNDDNAYATGCTSGRPAVEECATSPVAIDWRVLSSSVNVMYYDPSLTYPTWPGFADASFSAARSNPQTGSDGFDDIKDLAGFEYHVWIDDRGYTGGQPRRGSNDNSTTTPNGEVDLWDSHSRVVVNAGSVTVEGVSYAPGATGLNPTVAAAVTLSGAGAHPELNGRTIAEEQQNIANWYQFYRRRAYIAKAAVAFVLDANPSFRYGLSVINQHDDLFVEMPAPALTDYTAHNADMLEDFYQFDWPAMGTPLRNGLKRAGDYYDDVLTGKADPITDQCQQNFTVLFTDGYWNGGSPGVGDDDGDGHSNTLADVAQEYYDKDLSPLANNVAPNLFDTATHQHMVTFGVAFGVQGDLIDGDDDGWPDGLTESSDWGDPSCSDCPEKIDDMWHAAYNSRGRFIAAQTPADVLRAINSTLANIADRTSSASSVALNALSTQAGASLFQARFDSGNWSGELIAYDINSDGSLSTVIPWKTDDTFTLATNAWDAGRNILTYKPSSGTGIPFRWPTNPASPGTSELDTAHVAALNTNPDSGTVEADTVGEARLKFLRGDPSNESTGLNFRARSKLLGDLIHASPVHVGAPPFRYPDNIESVPYSSFKTAKFNRTPVVYVGSNDGMLHGFNADRGSAALGREILAYVPTPVFDSLNELTSLNYTHSYRVDGEMSAVDAFWSGAWYTVLAGGLRAGGQGIFALDVTSPSFTNFSEANADRVVLWEFTDADDADMGYSYSEPSIVKMQNDKWAVIIGNGYNNSEPDGNASTTGHAVLFILFIEDGADGTWSVTDYVKIDTGVGDTVSPNGLGSPAVIDTNGDFKADYVYAGDLRGNLWKFDINDSNVANWDVAYADAGSNPLPLFQTQSAGGSPQPISTKPDVGRHPAGNGFMVYFGTGKYLETGDNVATGQDTQTFYGIWDKNAKDGLGQPTLTAFNRGDLLQQSILSEVSGFGFDLRVGSDSTVNWHTASGTPSGSPPTTHLGWYLDLVNTEGGNTNNFGERAVTDPILRGDRIIFTTLLPSQNACDFGGSSWLMELAAADGGRLDESPFDLNNDGYFTSSDYATVLFDVNGDGSIDGDDKVPVSGKKSKVGIITKPGILSVANTDPGTEIKFVSGSTGAIEGTKESTSGLPSGRQSWRQILD
jgi:type IV pilus assembly protein PilY1